MPSKTLLVVIGFVAGYFLRIPIMTGLTLISVIVASYMLATYKEMAQLIAIAWTFALAIANVAMWGALFLTSDKQWLIEFSHKYILR